MIEKLTWDDLLILDLDPDDCQEWLDYWAWLVHRPLAPVFLNKFGSWFLRCPEGHVEMLNVLSGTIENAADTYEEFIKQVNEPVWQKVYLLSEQVYELHQQEKVPGPGQCYALAPHPAIAGPNLAIGDRIDPRFVVIMDIGHWQRLCVHFLRGTRRRAR